LLSSIKRPASTENNDFSPKKRNHKHKNRIGKNNKNNLAGGMTRKKTRTKKNTKKTNQT
jgi:hypothetical protein